MDYTITKAASATLDILQGFLQRILKDIDSRLITLETDLAGVKTSLLNAPASAGVSSFVGNPAIPPGTAIKVKYDAKGLVTKAEEFTMADVPGLADSLSGKANTAHGHAPSDITGLSEAIDDRVSALLFAGAGVSLNYNDTANQLEIVVSGASVTQHTYMPGGW